VLLNVQLEGIVSINIYIVIVKHIIVKSKFLLYIRSHEYTRSIPPSDYTEKSPSPSQVIQDHAASYFRQLLPSSSLPPLVQSMTPSSSLPSSPKMTYEGLGLSFVRPFLSSRGSTGEGEDRAAVLDLEGESEGRGGDEGGVERKSLKGGFKKGVG
jgi:hypothetical protein